MDEKQKHILVAVLDWGLGHATRCIPIIEELLRRGHKVSIAGSGSSLVLLKKEFDQLTFFSLPSYGISYSFRSYLPLKIFFQLPRILLTIKKEKIEIERIIKSQQVDVLISDNRYGCYSKEIKSIIITHQLSIQLPPYLQWFKKLVDSLIRKSIGKFNECWVPDDIEFNLSGQLSKGMDLSARFIGSLSRLKKDETTEVEKNLFLALISGPEPQRTLFEKIVLREFRELNINGVILRGLPHVPESKVVDGNLTLITHASRKEINELIQKAEIIISRSGYSTIMDLYSLNKKNIVFVPTPGQTEQEYLASWMEERQIAIFQSQDEFNLAEAISSVENYMGFAASGNPANLLSKAIDEIIEPA